MLLREHQITYQYEHTEHWSRQLHGSAGIPGSQPDTKNELKVLNPLGAVLRAYVTRIRQFRDLIQTNGAVFVWALQATMHSKRTWSAAEREALAYWGDRDQAIRDNMARLYDLLESELPERDRAGLVDLNKDFGEHDADKDLFWDFIHPTPAGHSLIAECVFKHLQTRGALDEHKGLSDGIN